MPRLFLTILAPAALCAAAAAQENVRDLDGPGVQNKYLTPGNTDAWKIELRAGETLRVHVSTQAFDPVASLVDADENVLLEVDDEGSEARMAPRVEEAGEYQIRVRGFAHRGGGNYRLDVEVFRTQPATPGEKETVRLDHDGRAYLRFRAQQGRVLVPVVRGELVSQALLAPDGALLEEWLGSYRVDETGEHVLALHGQPDGALGVEISMAERMPLEEAVPTEAELPPGHLHVHEFTREQLDFRVITVTSAGAVRARLIRAPVEEDPVTRADSFEMRALPVQSKGRHRRFATVFGRAGDYELQVLSRDDATLPYEVTMRDPADPLEVGATAEGRLPVGGSEFHRIYLQNGQLLRFDLRSEAFDPLLRLFDASGRVVVENDDAGDGLHSRAELLVNVDGAYLLQVASHGGGGGGEYLLSAAELQVGVIAAGEARTAEFDQGGRRYWHFDARAGQAMLASARSLTCDPALVVLGPDGVVLGRNDDGGVGNDALLPFEVTRGGRHTLWVESRGGGTCEVRLLPLD